MSVISICKSVSAPPYRVKYFESYTLKQYALDDTTRHNKSHNFLVGGRNVFLIRNCKKRKSRGQERTSNDMRFFTRHYSQTNLQH